MAMSDRHHDNNSIYYFDERLSEELRNSLGSMLERNGEKLRRLKDVKTLIECYKRTREYKQQTEEQDILSFILSTITEELLKQMEPYYVDSILRNIEIQTRIKKVHSTVEVNSKIDFNASLKPYVEFTVEINKKESYSVKFTFQIETNAYVKKLRSTTNTDKSHSINIERLGTKMELSLLQIKFSDLIISSSDISFNKKMKLGISGFEIHDLGMRRALNKKYNMSKM